MHLCLRLRLRPVVLICLAAFAVVVSPPRAHGAEHVVEAGGKIQDAVAKAVEGDTIKVMPGVYRESVFIDKPRISLIGVIKGGKWPKLEGDGKLNDGVIASGSGFRIENLHIANYKGNGVMTQGASNVVMRHLLIDHTGIYGIYPTQGVNIVVEDTVTWGIADAGIYISNSDHVDVRRNEVYANVAGIEIENSRDVLVEANACYDNVAGILVFALPGLPKKDAARVVVRRNFVYDNNHANFAAAGAIVANVPPGVGIILLASDVVTIEDNIIRDHGLGAVFVADLGILPNTSPDPAVDPVPDDTRIRRNLFQANGARDFAGTLTWLHYLARNILAGNVSDAATEDIFPKGGDVVFLGKSRGTCIDNPEALTIVGVGEHAPCQPPDAASTLTTMLVAPDAAPTAPLDPRELGAATFGAVCSGCHAYALQRIGPAVTEIQQKYKDNPAGIVAFATSPKKVRPGFPDMPPQAYLGAEKLEAVARHMLDLRN